MYIYCVPCLLSSYRGRRKGGAVGTAVSAPNTQSWGEITYHCDTRVCLALSFVPTGGRPLGLLYSTLRSPGCRATRRATTSPPPSSFQQALDRRAARDLALVVEVLVRPVDVARQQRPGVALLCREHTAAGRREQWVWVVALEWWWWWWWHLVVASAVVLLLLLANGEFLHGQRFRSGTPTKGIL
jgi:hypothetical protein